MEPQNVCLLFNPRFFSSPSSHTQLLFHRQQSAEVRTLQVFRWAANSSRTQKPTSAECSRTLLSGPPPHTQDAIMFAGSRGAIC